MRHLDMLYGGNLRSNKEIMKILERRTQKSTESKFAESKFEKGGTTGLVSGSQSNWRSQVVEIDTDDENIPS